MTFYTCPVCAKIFKQKSHYSDHINKKKKPCKAPIIDAPKPIINAQLCTNNEIIAPKIEVLVKNNQENTEKNQIKLSCDYCNKSFVRAFCLNRHLDGRCKSKNKLDKYDVLKSEFDKLVLELEASKKENDDLKKQIVLKSTNTNIIGNNNTNTNNNNTVNINIVTFGKEDISKIDVKEIVEKHLMKAKGVDMISLFLKYMHFNDKLPENKNIYLSDFNRELLQLKTIEGWSTKKYKDMVVKPYQTLF